MEGGNSILQKYLVDGVLPKSFLGRNGEPVNGSEIFVSWPIDPKRGQGRQSDHFFLSAAKLAALPFTIAPSMTVNIVYNRFAKVDTLILVDDDLIDLS